MSPTPWETWEMGRETRVWGIRGVGEMLGFGPTAVGGRGVGLAAACDIWVHRLARNPGRRWDDGVWIWLYCSPEFGLQNYDRHPVQVSVLKVCGERTEWNA